LIWVNGVKAAACAREFDAAQEHRPRPVTSCFPTQEEEAMPVDVMILSAAIVAVFVIFGSVLYWGERRTRDLSPSVESVEVKRRSF
jgi:hypothetical protein